GSVSRTGLSRSVGRINCALLPVVLALVLLPAIAFASPPDPSWIAGIYDGADGDDVVSLVDDTTAVGETTPPEILSSPSADVAPSSQGFVAPGLPVEHYVRGPPPSAHLVTYCRDMLSVIVSLHFPHMTYLNRAPLSSSACDSTSFVWMRCPTGS